MKLCNSITFDSNIVGQDTLYRTCIRREGHSGPHLIQRTYGMFVAYETDWGCDCENCRGDDQDLWCEVYREVTQEEACALMQTIDEVFTLS